jgi:hypothetical protein
LNFAISSTNCQLFKDVKIGHFCSGDDLAKVMSWMSDKKERAAIMDYIIDATKEPNINGLLLCAAAHCDSDTILKILKRGADFMAKDLNHCLPLELAIAENNSKYPFLKHHYYTPVLKSPSRGEPLGAKLLFLLKQEQFKNILILNFTIGRFHRGGIIQGVLLLYAQ